MPLWDSLTQLFQRDAQHLDRPVLPGDHVFPAPADTEAVAAGESYFQLWVVEMFLASDRDWFKSWYPVVQSLTTFRFGNQPNPIDIAQVAGPGYLRNIDPNHLDRTVQVDFPLTPLVPFSGGTVQVEAGLVAMQGSDTLRRFLDVMGNFAGLLAVPQLSTALSVANAVTRGVEQLLGASDRQMVLGFQRTYESAGGGGDNALRAGYVAIFRAPGGTYPSNRLWVKDSRLLYGADVATATPITGVDYMLLRIETRKHRDDWDALTTIQEPFSRAVNALNQLDANGNVDVANADAYIRSAVVAALNSPDLAARDRAQVARAIRDRYAEYKAAVVGERGLELPMPPTISDVARLAQGLSATPVTAGELFPD